MSDTVELISSGTGAISALRTPPGKDHAELLIDHDGPHSACITVTWAEAFLPRGTEQRIPQSWQLPSRRAMAGIEP